MGFVCRFLFYALELAGALISMEMGLNLPAAFNPISQGPSTLPAAVLNQLAIVIWLTLDLHHWLLAGFQRSFAILPVGVARFGEAALIRMTGGVGDLFVIAMQLAAPILAVSFIISLVFALLGRAVPQMPVFSESFAVRLMAGLGVFGVSMQLFATQISQHLRQLPEDMLQLVQLLQG
jgi:flagellar biosynthetic protein FliR